MYLMYFSLYIPICMLVILLPKRPYNEKLAWQLSEKSLIELKIDFFEISAVKFLFLLLFYYALGTDSGGVTERIIAENLCSRKNVLLSPPSETKLDSHDKKHDKTWNILPRSCHVTWQENIKICTNLYDLCMAIKKQDLGKISKKD